MQFTFIIGDYTGTKNA